MDSYKIVTCMRYVDSVMYVIYYSLLEQRDRDKVIKLTGDQTTCTVKEADNDEAEHPSLQDDSNPGCLKLVLQGRNLSITY